MARRNNHSWLVKFAFKLLKYFLLMLSGFTIACVLSSTFGIAQLAALILTLMRQWLLRSAILVFSFVATAIIVESVRY